MCPIDDEDLPIPDPAKLNFRERLRAGRVVLIISDEAIFDLLLGGYKPFVQGYADHVKSHLGMTGDIPAFCNNLDLVTMVKYHKHGPRPPAVPPAAEQAPMADEQIKSDLLNYVKNYLYRAARAAGADDEILLTARQQVDRLPVSSFAALFGHPRLDRAEGAPLLTLARLPFKTILTTSPYTFIEDALVKAEKRPRTEVCRWKQELRDTIGSVLDTKYEPSSTEPLVYHLLGLDRYADSLVLTEDDYLEYLGNICQGKDDESADFIPGLVRKVFSNDLMMLGFGLNTWAFRVLYAGLIRRGGRSGGDKRGVCGVQVPDTPEERSYLLDYMQREARFEVFLGEVQEYVRQELQEVAP